MENQEIAPEKLGMKTFVIFFIKRCPLLIILLLILAGVIAAKPYVPYNYVQYDGPVVSALVAIFFIFVAITILIAWLEFIRYKIFITPESIKINRGILSEEELGVPFRRVQDATIKRGIGHQLIGASVLVLNVLGEEGAQSLSRETRIVLPALDQKMALRIQDMILKKAEVEEVSMETKSI